MDTQQTPRIGDTVRLVGVPPDLPKDDEHLSTSATFQKCLGHAFSVGGLNEIGWAELVVESVTGNVGETIWVEPQFLEIVSSHQR